MGSQSDYKTMKLAEKTLKKIGVSFETKIVSAHRTPKRMYDYALKAEQNNKVAIIMGSQSDYSVMKDCEKILKILKIKYQVSIVSAHRTPKRMFEFAETAEKKGFAVIIAGAGGAAHLAGMVASLTTLPVLGVPIETKKLKGLDSLLSMAQMPKGIPIGCLAIDGAFNAGILAASIISNFDDKVKSNLEKWRRIQTQSIKKKPK